MKSIAFKAVNRLLFAVTIAAIPEFSGTAFCVTDPTLDVSLTRTDGGVMLSWGGFKAVPYQVQASSTLADWTSISAVMTGTGATLSFTNSGLSQSRLSFRVERLFPAAPGSAAFNPATGLLTIVADALHTVINVANDGTGVILVNVGAIPIAGGPAKVANTVLIQVLGSAG